MQRAVRNACLGGLACLGLLACAAEKPGSAAGPGGGSASCGTPADCGGTAGSHSAGTAPSTEQSAGEAGTAATPELGPRPQAPRIDGEPSAGHTDLVFTWDQPALTDHFVVVLDDGAEQTLPLEVTRFEAEVELGAHVLEVRACNALGGCTPSMFETVVELFGEGYPPPWRGVRKADLATSPLGNVVPLSCHNCYSDRPGNVVLDAPAALAKVGRALERRADLIELDLADIGGVLHVSHDDAASAGAHPTLESLLGDVALRDAEAMLFLEIKESGTAPDTFAKLLLDLLDQHRDYVKNGRPLFLRHFDSGLRYLKALDGLLPSYPMLEHYVRFSILYAARDDVAALQADIAADAADNGFWGIELEYRNPSIMGAVRAAQSLGLAAGLYTVPGPGFGEVYLGALRDEVDQLTTEYRIDQARAIVEAKSAAGRVDVSRIVAVGPIDVRGNMGSLVSEQRSLGIAPTGSLYGSPGLLVNAQGEDLFGGVLDFRSSQGFTQRALPLFDVDAAQGQGYLVSLVVNFDTLSLGAGQTMALLNKAEAGGFALELANQGQGTKLRFGVNVGGSYAYHAYDVTGQNQAGACGGAEGGYFTEALNGTDSYLISGAYDGAGGVYLFIDNRCVAALSPSVTGGVAPSSVPILVGADPQPSAASGAQFYFDGLLQSATVSSWGSHTADAVNQ